MQAARQPRRQNSYMRFVANVAHKAGGNDGGAAAGACRRAVWIHLYAGTICLKGESSHKIDVLYLFVPINYFYLFIIFKYSQVLAVVKCCELNIKFCSFIFLLFYTTLLI